MNDRRRLLQVSTAIGAAGMLNAWKTPLINAVILPAHAQTSVVGLNCSMTDLSLNPIVDGSTVNEDILLTFTTVPSMPGAAISWVGRCNGADDFAIQHGTLDENGELLITIETSRMCGGGPPNNGDVIQHNGVLDVEGSAVNCSVIYG